MRYTTLLRGLFLSTLAVGALAATACGDDDDSSDSTPAPTSAPEPVTIAIEATADAITGVPETIAPGFTRFQITVEPGETSHALVFLRAAEGVTPEGLIAAAEAQGGPDPEQTTIAGGATTIEAGAGAEIILELEPGLYSISDVPEGELVHTVTFQVEGDGGTNTPPVADSVIEMGPGLAYTLSDGFDGQGTIEVINNDTDLHEAGFISLGEGTTTEAIIGWVEGGFEGPPPDFAFMGGFGPVDAGGRGWVVSDLPPGDYAIICFIFDESGPHFANGMLAEFTVE